VAGGEGQYKIVDLPPGRLIHHFSLAVFETERLNLQQSVSGAYTNDLDLSDVERVGVLYGPTSQTQWPRLFSWRAYLSSLTVPMISVLTCHRSAPPHPTFDGTASRIEFVILHRGSPNPHANYESPTIACLALVSSRARRPRALATAASMACQPGLGNARQQNLGEAVHEGKRA
jgi:hypothetical protein